MATELEYNGVSLTALKTRAYERVAVHTPDGCDYLYTRYRLAVDGMLSRYLNSFAPDGSQAENFSPCQSDTHIRRKLLAKRKPLLLTVKGETSLRSPNVGFNQDACRGPRPLRCDITRIDGSGAMMVSYGIETCLDENVGSPNGDSLRSNRWRQVDRMDGNYATTRITAGQAVFGGDLLGNAGQADALRVRFWPSVPRFMKRENAEVSIAEDGRTINYQIVDVEKLIPGGPLCPMTTWEAFYTTVSRPSAASTSQQAFTGMVNVSAQGPTTVPQWLLLTTAIRIAMMKLRGDGDSVIPVAATVTMGLHARLIQLQVEAILSPPRVLLGKFPIDDWRLAPSTHDADMAEAFAPFGDIAVAPKVIGDRSRGTFTQLLRAQIIRDDLSSAVAPPP